MSNFVVIWSATWRGKRTILNVLDLYYLGCLYWGTGYKYLFCSISIHSPGYHARSIHKHSLQYQGDESRREKTEFQVNYS